MMEEEEDSLEDNCWAQRLGVWRLSREAVKSLGTRGVPGQCRFCWLEVAEDVGADSRQGSGCGWA